MNANDITERIFEKAGFKGYKSDEVDEHLREVAANYNNLQRERDELERKLEILADKIREYRKDEDALKEALLGAHRQGNLLMKDASEKAEIALKEAESKSAQLLSSAEEKAKKQISDANEYAKKTIEDANYKASQIVADAKRNAEQLRQKEQQQLELEHAILIKTREEVNNYRSRLLSSYKAHIEIINSLPTQLENEQIRRIAEQAERKKAEDKVVEKAEPIVVEPAAPKETTPAQAVVEEKVEDAQQSEEKAVEGDNKTQLAESFEAKGMTKELNSDPFFSFDETKK